MEKLTHGNDPTEHLTGDVTIVNNLEEANRLVKEAPELSLPIQVLRAIVTTILIVGLLAGLGLFIRLGFWIAKTPL